MDIDPATLTVRRNDALNRFEATQEGQVAELIYRREGRRITYDHTTVPTALEGQGIAGRLAHDALEYARIEGLQVVPKCEYVRGYIERHPEYADLVAS